MEIFNWLKFINVKQQIVFKIIQIIDRVSRSRVYRALSRSYSWRGLMNDSWFTYRKVYVVINIGENVF